jgi:hypothetical protein
MNPFTHGIRLFLGLGVFAVTGLAGCSGVDDPIDGAGGAMVEAPFAPQANGTETVLTVISATPDPPLRADYNAWTVTIATADGEPLTDCEITADPRMPAHGHGTTPRPEVTPMEDQDGVYRVSPLNLFMAGLWEITFQYTCGDIEDAVAVTVVVES